MNTKFEIIELINKKSIINRELSSLIVGSMEIRKKNDRSVIYIHYRESGLRRTKYIGLYSDELFNRITNDNIKAKALKKELRNIEKSLKSMGYVGCELSDKVKVNIDLAKRNMVDTIYKQAVLEGVAVTYLDTETIIEGGKINNVTCDDVMKINNLKHAWQFILDEGVVTSDSDFALLCTINSLIEEGFYYNAGKLRVVPVAIGGTSWRPQLPIESQVKAEIEEILQLDDVYERAIEALLYVTKRQLFIDGNKRTAVVFANHILINAGGGLAVIPDSDVAEYKKLLIEYYETDKKDDITNFIKEKCLIKI